MLYQIQNYFTHFQISFKHLLINEKNEMLKDEQIIEFMYVLQIANHLKPLMKQLGLNTTRQEPKNLELYGIQQLIIRMAQKLKAFSEVDGNREIISLYKPLEKSFTFQKIDITIQFSFSSIRISRETYFQMRQYDAGLFLEEFEDFFRTTQRKTKHHKQKNDDSFNFSIQIFLLLTRE